MRACVLAWMSRVCVFVRGESLAVVLERGSGVGEGGGPERPERGGGPERPERGAVGGGGGVGWPAVGTKSTVRSKSGISSIILSRFGYI